MIKHSTAVSVTAELFNGPTGPSSLTVAESHNLDLQQRVRTFLAGSNVPGMRHVEIEIVGDTVYLRGQVRTFYEKQLAARLSRRVAGVIHVVDLIEVQSFAPPVNPVRSSRRGSQHSQWPR